jgi:hypothetical protein
MREGYRFWFFFFPLPSLPLYNDNSSFQFDIKYYWGQLGSKFFKVYQNPLTMSPFFVFFTSSLLLPCKDTFMDEYDGIYNCNGLIYSNYEIFNIF